MGQLVVAPGLFRTTSLEKERDLSDETNTLPSSLLSLFRSGFLQAHYSVDEVRDFLQNAGDLNRYVKLES